MAERFDIRVGERTLEAAWHGPRPNEAPTIVLLHEGLGSVSAWRDWPAELVKQSGFGVLAYSRFGYGESSPATMPRPVSYMHEEAADVLPVVIAQPKLEKFILVGHSDGASIAILYAGGEHVSPLLKGAVLMSPHVFVEDISIASIARARDLFGGRDLRARLGKHHRDVEQAFWGWNRVWLDPEFRSWNIEDAVPKIRVPLLLIQEKDDPYGTLQQIEAIEEGARALTKPLILPGNGHSPWKEQREITTREIVLFARGTLA